MTIREPKVMFQKSPWPYDLQEAIEELSPTGSLTGWRFWLEEENRGQGCHGLTLSIIPNNTDSYHPEKHACTRFIYPVPAAAFNRESWEEWIWARIEDTERHERAEGFRFRVSKETSSDGVIEGSVEYRRPFKPAHPDGWDPSVIRTVVSETVVNTPNAGRLVLFPCRMCGHNHRGKMGEHFTIEVDAGCMENCTCNDLGEDNG